MDKLRGIVAKIFLVVLFGMLIVSFAIWGIGDIFRGRSAERVVAEVGSRKISEEEFRRALAGDLSRIQQQLGRRLEPEMVRAFGLPQQVLDRLVAQALYDSLAEDLEMTVTDEQVRQTIFSSRLFRGPTGEFDRARFAEALRSNQMGEGEYIALLRQEMKREQIVSALSSGVTVPEALASRLYAYRAEKRRGDYVAIEEAAIEDLPEAGEEDLRKLYERGSERYLAPEYRRIALLRIAPESLAGQLSVAEADLKAAFEERKAQFARPERRAIEQILLDSREKAEAAFAELQEGVDFETVAKTATGEPPVELGTLTRAELQPQIAEAAFTLDPGHASAPVESGFGWHILRVTGIEPAYEPVFEEVSDRLRQDLLRQRGVESAIDLANQLDDTLAGGATLEEAAQQLDLPLVTLEAIDRSGRDPAGKAVEGMPPASSFLDVVFSTEVGTDSLLQETEAGGYYVVRVDEVTAARPRPLEAVRDQLMADWKAEKQKELARERAEAIEAKLSQGAELGELAAAEGLEVVQAQPVTRFGREPSGEFASVLFELEPGQSAVANGPQGPLVTVLREIIPATPGEDSEGLEAVRQEARRSMVEDMLSLTGRQLQRRFGVTVNQTQLDQALASF